jgi:amino acid transporter
MLVLTLKSSFVAALTISTIARLVAYAVTCAALPVLRKGADAPPAHFKLRGGPVIAIAALVLSAWLLLNSTLYEAIAAAIAAAVGFAIYLAYSSYLRSRAG